MRCCVEISTALTTTCGARVVGRFDLITCTCFTIKLVKASISQKLNQINSHICRIVVECNALILECYENDSLLFECHHQCFVSSMRAGLLDGIGADATPDQYNTFSEFAIRAIFFDISFWIVISIIGWLLDVIYLIIMKL